MSRVFIALAAWEPDQQLLDRQLASLSAQTFDDWSGVVLDDGSSERSRTETAARVAREPRLRFVAGVGRVGFYRNFERALGMAPATCDFIALCDQDDCWSARKLERQVAALEAHPAAQLCYTDLRIVGPGGGTLAESFWRGRPHGRSFREIFYNNAVTGASAMIRARLLQAALPFPDDAGGAFHDHWLALCAMASGELLYLDEPLVDYTQHGANAIGATPFTYTGRGAVVKFAGDAVRVLMNPRQGARDLDRLADYAVAADARLRSFALELSSRFPDLQPPVRSALRPLLRKSRFSRGLDLAGPTFLATLAAGHETNLAPLKIPAGLAWAALRGRSA